TNVEAWSMCRKPTSMCLFPSGRLIAARGSGDAHAGRLLARLICTRITAYTYAIVHIVHPQAAVGAIFNGMFVAAIFDGPAQTYLPIRYVHGNVRYIKAAIA